MEENAQHIDARDAEQARRTLERGVMTSLAARIIDYAGIHKQTIEAEENRLVPEYVEDFFLRAFRRLGGRISRRDDGTYSVAGVPYELRQWGDDYIFKNSYGLLFREYRRITFDKDFARRHPDVEFVAPGHPLLEALNVSIQADAC
ncbi:MAG: helicase, partial [Anaerolineae bacterium]|nr:helicase [Anaerolineae bacterium]